MCKTDKLLARPDRNFDIDNDGVFIKKDKFSAKKIRWDNEKQQRNNNRTREKSSRQTRYRKTSCFYLHLIRRLNLQVPSFNVVNKIYEDILTYWPGYLSFDNLKWITTC